MPSFKNVHMKGHYALFAVPLALSVIPFNVQAGCSRDDVDHYLEKGFTPSQVTSICGAPVAPLAPATTPISVSAPVVQQPVPQQYQYQQQYQQPPSQSSTKYAPVQLPPPDRNFLIDVINGYDTLLTDDVLAYTIKKCYELGEEDLFGFSSELCPEIRYTLNLNGMTIVESGHKYLLFGPPEIKLRGQVQREILTDLQDVKPELKELLFKEIDTGDEVVLPIQQGTPVIRVQKALHKILR